MHDRAPCARRAAVPPAAVAQVERLTDDAVAVTFDVPAELRRGLRVQARPGAHPAPRRRTAATSAASYSICAPGGRRAAGRRPRGARRLLLLVPGARGAAGRRDRGARRRRARFTADLSDARRPRLRRRRVGHHPGAVAGRPRVLRRRRVDGHRLLRQPAHQHGDVRRRAGRPEGPLRHPPAAGARALPRAARRRADQRPARRRTGCARWSTTSSTPSTSTTGGCAGRTGWSTDARALLDRARRAARRRCTRSSSTSTTSRRSRCAATRRPSPGPSSQVTVVLDGRATTLALPRDEPVLDSAQKVRGDLPFACKGGVCGTCRARVTERRGGHAAQLRAGGRRRSTAGYVLTCQSLPVTDTVTVDFDQ